MFNPYLVAHFLIIHSSRENGHPWFICSSPSTAQHNMTAKSWLETVEVHRVGVWTSHKKETKKATRKGHTRCKSQNQWLEESPSRQAPSFSVRFWLIGDPKSFGFSSQAGIKTNKVSSLPCLGGAVHSSCIPRGLETIFAFDGAKVAWPCKCPCLKNSYLSQPMGNMRNQRMNESIVNDEWVKMVGWG